MKSPTITCSPHIGFFISFIMLHFVLCTYYKIFLAVLAVPASMSIASYANAQSPKLRRRSLQDSAFKIFWLSETVRFEVPLFLELQYLNKTVIDQIENRGNTSDPQPQPVVDLCKCLTAQVRPLFHSFWLRASVRDH